MEAPKVNLLLWLLLWLGPETYGQFPPAGKQKVHLYLLAGQSNMAGRGTVEEADRQIHPRIWMLTQEGKWVPAAEPLHFDKPEAGVGPGLSFARQMAGQDTTAWIGLIPAAVGGSAIDSWQPGGYHDQTKSHPYDDAIRRARLAMQAGTLKGVLWHQGESDSKPERAGVYASKLTELITRFRRDLRAKQLPVVVGMLGAFYLTRTPSAATVNAAIRETAQRVRRVACVEATGLADKGDGIHFDAASARELGRRYARALQTLQAK